MISIHLYDYQEEMRQEIDAAFESYQSVMVQMPAGTGKTYLLASVVFEFMHRSDESVVWIIAHRKELVSQIEQTLSRFNLSVSLKEQTDSRIRVYSIQWLNKHLYELTETPSLIVIDEAHHALAKTYSATMNTFPGTFKLGLTATPCRLNGKGFTDLFDKLLYSDSINQFINNGFLSPFDYISIPSDSEEIRKIDGLVKRAADGDYNVAEMSEVLDTRPSIERLYNSIEEFAHARKGIVYAINIDHADHIAAFYREKGLTAEAISSKTSDKERSRLVYEFREGLLQVLVNVDIFSEGFDCPDVEFIQMARPTLSLAKYLQQVGRGLRIHEEKKCCILLDNVGLYRLFGLPTNGWNWQSMFDGRVKGKGEVCNERMAFMRLFADEDVKSESDDTHTRMVVLARHEDLQERNELYDMIKLIGADVKSIRRMSNGWMLSKGYILKGRPYKFYRRTGVRNFGYDLMIDANGMYYTFHECSEKLTRVGKNEPWIAIVDKYLKPNPKVVRNMMPKNLSRTHSEYVWKAEFMGKDDVYYFRSKYYLGNGKKMYIYDDYNSISKAIDGIRTFIDMDENYGIMNQDGNYYILWDKSFIKLYPDSLAYVKDRWGNYGGRWINLYTMQEFEIKPEIVQFGFVKMLKVGDDYFLHQARMATGIPLKEEDFVYNDNIFQFFDNYVILRDDSKKVLFLDKGYKKEYEYNFKLTDVRSVGVYSDDYGFIPQGQLPGKALIW